MARAKDLIVTVRADLDELKRQLLAMRRAHLGIADQYRKALESLEKELTDERETEG